MIEYPGHMILVQGGAMDPAKVSSVLNWSQAKSVGAVCAFLGLTEYYRRFIKGYIMIMQLLTQLLKKESQFKFVRDGEAQAAFVQLKQALVSSPVLAALDFSKPFVLECDASGLDVGAILMQE